MPIYIYESIPRLPDEEPSYFEFEQHMADEPFTTHPETGVPLRRIFRGGFQRRDRVPAIRRLRRLLWLQLGPGMLRVTVAGGATSPHTGVQETTHEGEWSDEGVPRAAPHGRGCLGLDLPSSTLGALPLR
jgi:hypothetical protein